MQCISRSKHYRAYTNFSNFINYFNKNHLHSTVDISDVEHHSKLAETWWDLNGPVAPLHSLNTLR